MSRRHSDAWPRASIRGGCFGRFWDSVEEITRDDQCLAKDLGTDQSSLEVGGMDRTFGTEFIVWVP